MKAKTKKARKRRAKIRRAAKLYWLNADREEEFDRNLFWGEELLAALSRR